MFITSIEEKVENLIGCRALQKCGAFFVIYGVDKFFKNNLRQCYKICNIIISAVKVCFQNNPVEHGSL